MLVVNQSKLLSAFEAALTSGGDSRTCLGPDGRNKYFSAARPQRDTFLLGSCTSSSISPNGYEVALKLFLQLEAIKNEQLQRKAMLELYESYRQELLSYLFRFQSGQEQVVIVPSGTDAEYLALWAAWVCSGNRPLSNIVIGPAELGSGSVVAAAARYFDAQTPSGVRVTPGKPIDERLEALTRVHQVDIRGDGGKVKEGEEIDREVAELIERDIAEGRHVLLHIVAHSKTGIHAPTLDVANRLKLRHGGRKLSIVVDAAQGRFSRTGLRQVVADGCMAIITGSKFYGGPGFCGAVVFPEQYGRMLRHEKDLPDGFHRFLCAGMFPSDWHGPRAALGGGVNLGVLLRWCAAVAEIIRYYQTPSRLRFIILKAFERLVPEVFADSEYIDVVGLSKADQPGSLRLLQSNTTVFSFSLGKDRRFNREQLELVFRWLTEDLSGVLSQVDEARRSCLAAKFQLGQPVTLMKSQPEETSVLRVAIGGVQIADLAVEVKYGRTLGQRLLYLKTQLELLRGKLELIAMNFDALRDDAK